MTSDSQSVLSVTGCLKVVGVLVLLTVVALLVMFVVARSAAEWVVNEIAAIPQSVAAAVSDAFRTETRAITETKVELAKAIQPMGMLVTASHKGAADVKAGIRNGILNLCGVEVDHRADVTVEAGVDLAQVSASDFTRDVGANTWTLTLGAARIHSCRIDYIEQHSHTFTLCRQDWDDYRLLAEYDALNEIRDQVKAEGLLPNAELVAKGVLENLVRAVTGSYDVRVSFESEPEPEFPDSCKREPPQDWRFDEESDSWVKE